ncbi:MAG: hypothetical protein V2I54_00775 [Bacteroidales bacterium]|jgi:hypothetical protein|nr:hypothetical protein [Bacteroidales bacterium]
MKKLIYLSLVFIFLIPSYLTFAQGDVETIAKEVIKAYKNQDAGLLKKHASGMMMYVINDSFFESDDGKPLVDIAQQWTGKIKEIRYSKGDVMGKEVLLASVYFSDNPNGNLNVVILSSFDKSDWKAFALGITDISREEFEQGETSLGSPSADKSIETKTDVNREGYSIEMANGDMFENPSDKKIIEALQSLNDDNFFMILSGKDGFIQTSTSEQGFIVQYSDEDGMFEAEEYFSLDKLEEIFIAYVNQQNWKKMATWVEM